MKHSWDTLRTGQSQLDVLSGRGREGYVGGSLVLPRSVVDFRSHSRRIKSPGQACRVRRALEKRTASAIENGVDASDPMVMTRLMVDAYEDANRSISLQDNRVVSAYRRGMRALEEKDKKKGRVPVGNKIGSTIAKTVSPIVRVPTNIIAETILYALGTVTGSARLAMVFRRGIEKFQPDEADLILRDLKKGSLARR